MPVRARWRGLELPVQVRAVQGTLTDRYGEFIAEPFERGYGHTVGNSLRRVLLSSLEGSAVVAVRFEGVQQEFTSIPNVLEDVTEIVLNIKEMVLKMHSNEEKTLKIDYHGTGVVKAGDIEADPDVEVIESGQEIATLTDETNFKCELIVRKGRGYVPSEEHEGLSRQVGLIPVDSLFSPVQRVAYRTEETRVGRKTDYDRLLLEIWTNGVVAPEMALVEAAKILRKHLNPFVQYFELGRRLPSEEPEPLAPVKHLEQPKVTEAQLTMPVSALELGVRATNCLAIKGIKTVGELLEQTAEELLAIKSFGEVTLRELQNKLAELGLEIGLLAPEEEEE